MAIKYYPEMVQGSDEWFSVRCGILTASEMKNVINNSLDAVKPTKKDLERGKDITHLYELMAQRLNNYVEPSYIGDVMLRGHEDEVYARDDYSKTFSPVTECGFITNDKFGFVIGYSPDGLVEEDGQIEGKSRIQKYQVETILSGEMPDDFKVQVQTGLLVSERKWCDFISYPAMGGMESITIRVEADKAVQDAIIAAACDFEGRLQQKIQQYKDIVASGKARLIKTERRKPEVEMVVE